MMSERELCDTLTRDARLQVEDVQGGVALVLKPRAGRDLSTLREHARHIERRTEHNAGSSIGPSCELFVIGRGGATTAIAEAPDAVRILITTSDATQVQSIRRQVREFVNKGADKSGSQGSRGQGTSGQGSGTQSGSGSRGQGSGSGSQGSGSGSQGSGSGSQGSGSGNQGSGSGNQGSGSGSQGSGSGSQSSGSGGGQ